MAIERLFIPLNNLMVKNIAKKAENSRNSINFDDKEEAREIYGWENDKKIPSKSMKRCF